MLHKLNAMLETGYFKTESYYSAGFLKHQKSMVVGWGATLYRSYAE